MLPPVAKAQTTAPATWGCWQGTTRLLPRKKRSGWRRKGSRTSWSLFSEKTKSSLHLATPPTLKPRATHSPSTCLPFKNEEKLVFVDCGGKNLPSLKPVPHSILISCLFPLPHPGTESPPSPQDFTSQEALESYWPCPITHLSYCTRLHTVSLLQATRDVFLLA